MGLRKERGIIANLIWCLKQLCKYKKEFIGVFLIESIVRGISPVVSLVLIQQIIDGNAGILGTIKTMFSLTSAVVSMVSYAVIIIKYNILIFVLIILIPIIRYFFEKNIIWQNTR